jgi:excisionase family DNA binding protein
MIEKTRQSFGGFGIMNQLDNHLVTTKQIAQHLQVTEITIFRWREKGMPFKRIGGHSIRFDLKEVNKWMEQKQNT